MSDVLLCRLWIVVKLLAYITAWHLTLVFDMYILIPLLIGMLLREVGDLL